MIYKEKFSLIRDKFYFLTISIFSPLAEVLLNKIYDLCFTLQVKFRNSSMRWQESIAALCQPTKFLK